MTKTATLDESQRIQMHAAMNIINYVMIMIKRHEESRISQLVINALPDRDKTENYDLKKMRIKRNGENMQHEIWAMIIRQRQRLLFFCIAALCGACKKVSISLCSADQLLA